MYHSPPGPVPVSAPDSAAAMPVIDFVAEYADRLADKIEVGSRSFCEEQSNTMRQIGKMDASANTRQIRVDAIFDVLAPLCL